MSERAASMASEPLITVLITPRLRLDFLAEAVASVRAQTVPVELIVALDPRPAAELRALIDPLQLGGHWVVAERAGLGARLDAGLSRTTGRYVAILAAEDVALPDRVESQVAILEARECDAVFSPPMLIDSAGLPLVDDAAPAYFSAKPADFFARPLRALTEHPRYLSFTTALVRRSLLTDLSPAALGNESELDYWLRAVRLPKRFIMSAEPVTKLRLSGKFERHVWNRVEEDAVVEAIRLADAAELRREFADLLPIGLPSDSPREVLETIILLYHAAPRVRAAGAATAAAILAAGGRAAELVGKLGVNEAALRRSRFS